MGSDFNYTKSEWEHLIKEQIIGLNAKRNQSIIRDKLFEGLSIQQIAEKYDLSETRVKTVIRMFKRKISGRK